jgi:hypothetical protein
LAGSDLLVEWEFREFAVIRSGSPIMGVPVYAFRVGWESYEVAVILFGNFHHGSSGLRLAGRLGVP